MAKILVNETEITILEIDEKDYISLTDMVKGIENGLALIEKWLRNKNTIEFLGIWEEIYNPNFNSPEFEGIKNMKVVEFDHFRKYYNRIVSKKSMGHETFLSSLLSRR